MKVTVADIRKAIEGMEDTDEVQLDVADPPDDFSYGIDGIANHGGTLFISISEACDEEEDDEEGGEYFRYATTATEDDDNFIDHDSGFGDEEAAIDACHAAMMNGDANYGFVECCEDGDSCTVAVLRRQPDGTVNVKITG